MAAFLGTIFVWEKWLPQSHRGQAPALNRQGGNVRVAAPYHVEFIFQNEYATYTGRSGRASLRSRRSAGRGFFQLQKQTCQKLCGRFAPLSLKQDCFFRVSSSKIKSFFLVRLRRTTWFPSSKQFTVKLRSDSFQKLRMLRNRLSLKSSLHSESTDFHKTDV